MSELASFTKINTVTYVLEVLSDYFLPHVGELNYIQKAYYLGYIVFRLLSVYSGLEQPTDRDNFKYKRIELVGSLIYDLFREYYNLQQKEIHLEFEKTLYYNKKQYEENLKGLINENYRKVFSNDLQRSSEIQERVRHVKEQITKELGNPRFICDICKHHFFTKGTKTTHETTHLCKKVD